MIIFAAFVLFLALLGFMLFVVLKISSQVNERLNQMNHSIQEANKAIGQNLGNATSAFGSVKEQLGKLEETNRQIIAISRDISSLQELMRAPKFRGAMGETLLENLLSQVLPKENYQRQYRFKSADAVDAVIKLGGRLVPVDAKFSLENFQRMQDAGDEQSKESLRRKFIQDVKNRINEISSKYILPAENTYDFALMYIPAENVYYEVIIKEDIFSYSMLKKVIPVSPNTFYAYLQVICMGLRGLKVEENAKTILKGLGGISVETEKFREDFSVLGSHLLNAGGKYADAEKRLDKVIQRLADIQDTKQATSP
ncbi:MAG: DNA recombination protein RmuC [Candidatus Omnitrophica bacterium]|nr:DNA recombination protein RmuC [Candidatus Omnitrophota bacterium]MDD5042723.1 DNA recombination protein RmuC [Candidatus Omnitrophota bacterium]MDD5500498.1 DNA recombination protein RmuC [Candidatus Omnitrophota bacterium]